MKKPISRRDFLKIGAAAAALPAMDTKAAGQAKSQKEGAHMAFALTKLRNLYRETQLSPETAAIAFPDTPPYRRIADALNDRLKQHLGGKLPLLPLDPADAAPQRFPQLAWPAAPRHLVLLGNAIENPLFLQLYIHHRTLTDQYFPGPEGFFLETVANPWGDGRNAVLVGGSDLAGVRRAADALVAAVERHGGMLPYLRTGKSRRIVSVPGSAEDRAYLRAWRLNQLRIGDLPWPTNDYAYLFYLTGDPYWGDLYRQIVKTEVQRTHENGRWPRTLFDSYFNQYRMVLAWKMIEADPFFSDEDRLFVTNLLYEVGKWVRDLSYFQEKAYRGSNHQTYACLSLWQTHGYFSKYYGRTEFAEHLPLIAQIYALHRQSFRTPDDEPSTYLRMPRHLCCYDLENGQEAYFREGHLARLCEEIVQFIDNRGDMCSFGDCGEYDTVYRLGPWDIGTQTRAVSLLGTAAWYYGRKDFAWAQRFARRGLDWQDRLYPPMIYCRDFSQLQRYGCHGWEFQVPAFHIHPQEQPPTNLLGVVHCSLDPKGIELVTTNRNSPSPLPKPPIEHPEEFFTALSFRHSFDPKDEYLCLHGTATLNHSHHHANCLIRLTWRDRIVLAEGDEHKSLRRYHNGLTVVRNGEHHIPPGLARLKAQASFAHSGFSQTLLEEDNGLNWQRSIFWRHGDSFVILDRCTARAEGDYVVEGRWMTLGDAKLRDQTLHIHQQGERFVLANADASTLTLGSHLGRYVPDREDFRGYEHASSGYLRILRKIQRAHLKPGETLTYFSLVGPARGGEEIAFTRVAETVVRVGGKEPYLAGCAAEGWSSAEQEIEIAATQFVLGETMLSGIGLTRLAIQGKPILRADLPLSVEIDIASGKALVECAQPTTLSLRATGSEGNGQSQQADGEGLITLHLAAGRHELRLQEMAPGPSAQAILALPALPAVPAATVPGQALAVSEVRPTWRKELGEPARAVSMHAGLLAVGGSGGTIQVLDGQGRVHQKWQVEKPVRQLLLAPGTQAEAPCVLVGQEDTTLALYASDGRCLWSKRLERGMRQRPREAYALAYVAPPVSRTPCFLVGLADETLMAFSLAGEKLWEAQVQYHAITLVRPFVGANGKRRIVSGSEYFHLNLLDEQGQSMWQAWRGPACVAEVGDWDGDGQQEIVWGDWYGLLVNREDSNRILQEINLGGETVGLALRPEERACWAVSDFGELVKLTPEGVAWRRNAEAPITCLAYPSGAQARLVLGTQEGNLQLRCPSDGALLEAGAAGGPVLNIAAGPESVWTVTEDGIICGWPLG